MILHRDLKRLLEGRASKLQRKFCHATSAPTNNNADWEPNAVGDIVIVYTGQAASAAYVCLTYTDSTTHTWGQIA